MSEPSSSDGVVPQAGSSQPPPQAQATTPEQDRRTAEMFAEFQRLQLATHGTDGTILAPTGTLPGNATGIPITPPPPTTVTWEHILQRLVQRNSWDRTLNSH